MNFHTRLNSSSPGYFYSATCIIRTLEPRSSIVPHFRKTSPLSFTSLASTIIMFMTSSTLSTSPSMIVPSFSHTLMCLFIDFRSMARGRFEDVIKKHRYPSFNQIMQPNQREILLPSSPLSSSLQQRQGQELEVQQLEQE